MSLFSDMKKNPPPHKYYDVLVSEGDTEATILLYGYIGEMWEWNPEKGYEQTGIRDVDFVKELDALAKKYNTIHLRINSPGGEIFHGSAIVTAIRNCPATVHTWIDGVAASMAGIIWMAGKKRHMAKNGMLMLHSASGLCWGNASDMRELADTLDKFDESLIIAAADAVGMSEEDMQAKYFNFQDHWLTYNDVEQEGWLSGKDDYDAAAKLPADMASMTYRDLLAFFEAQGKPATDQPDMLTKIKAWLEEAKAAVLGQPSDIPSPNNVHDMKIEDFKASLTDGTLKLEDVKAFLESLTPPAAPAPTEDVVENEAITALRTENAALKTQMEAFEARLTAFGAQPGAGKSTPPLPDADLPSADGTGKTPKQLLDEDNAKMTAAALSGEALMVTPAGHKG